MDRNNFCCTSCNKSFTLKANLVRHVKTIHENVDKFICDVCEYSTSRSDSLKLHKLNHPSVRRSVQPSVFCALCTFKCSLRMEMRIHYETVHDVVLRAAESLEFENEPEFVEWKVTVEKEECAHFVLKRGGLITVSGCSNKTYYCFREGNFEGAGKKIRRQKALGTNKINAYCPARIDATFFPSGKVSVKFWKTHVGHVNELGRLKLSEKMRSNIASSIALGIPFDRILDSIRSSVTSSEIERDHLVNRKDLQNIARDYNLTAEGMRHGNDSTSVHLRVKEIEQSDNVVLLYKTQGEASMIKDLRSGKITEGSSSLEQIKEKMTREWKAIQDSITSEEVAKTAEKLLQEMKVTIAAHQSLLQNSAMSSFSSQEPAGKKGKFEPQRAFKSTKKTFKTVSSSIVAPTTQEKEDIAINLLSSWENICVLK